MESVEQASREELMRQFFLTFSKWDSLSPELSWTQSVESLVSIFNSVEFEGIKNQLEDCLSLPYQEEVLYGQN